MPKPHSLTRTLVLVAFALLSLASLTSSLDAPLMEAVRSNDVHATRSLLLQGHSPNTPSQVSVVCRLLCHSRTVLLTHSLTHSHFITHSHSLLYPLTHLPTHLPTHSPSLSLTHTHSLTHSLTKQDKADTPLHIACQNDFLLIIELLLQHHACVSAQDHLGLTPLHYSAYYGYTGAVAQLLEAGAGEHADMRDKVTHSLTHSLTHTLLTHTHTHTHSLIHSQTHSHTHTHTHSLTHSLTSTHKYVLYVLYINTYYMYYTLSITTRIHDVNTTVFPSLTHSHSFFTCVAVGKDSS